MLATLYKASDGTMNGLVDFRDPNNGSTGFFGPTSDFPGTNNGANDPFPGAGGDDIVIEVTGDVFIPSAGPWTFGTNSDDGTGLWVGPFSKIDDVLAGPHDHFATSNFASAGWNPLRLVYFERGGGAEVELFAAQGTHTSFNSSFQLVGDTANGGLLVATRFDTGIIPEPSTFLVWSLLAAVVGLGWRRRKR